VGRNPVYIAGVPANVGQKSIKQWHLRNDTSFIGKPEKRFYSFGKDVGSTMVTVTAPINSLEASLILVA
jgi:hypothetical protein